MENVLVDIEKERLYPIYFLNQNYIRFNHGVINIDFLKQFLQHQHFRLNNYIVDEKLKSNQENQINAFIEYDFSLHHIHNEKYLRKHLQPTAQSKNKKKETIAPAASQKIVTQAIEALKKISKNEMKIE